jgi:hypothetical protein
VALAAAAPSLPVSAAVAAPATTAPSSGGSSSTALGLVALIGASGAALLRARQLAAATGLDDAGTLTALGNSISTFWAGSCVSVGAGGAAPVGASLGAEALSPVSALGNRIGFGVKGAVADAADAVGGRLAAPLSPFVRGAAVSDDRTGLVATLFVASAIVGAALGALAPRRQQG